MTFALVGNQNSGKTTLFNQLTGANQRVGNFPGVTVERKEGTVKFQKDVTLVDLPGIYSLSPYSNEEIISRDYITKNKPDAIINIVDAMNIERNLYLSLQLIGLNIPMVIALNMMDELRSNGGTIKVEEMSEELGVPVVPISAIKAEGLNELMSVAINVAKNDEVPKRQDFCGGAVHRAIHATTHLVEDHADKIGIPAKFAATKLIERDKPLEDALELDDHELHMIEECILHMEGEILTDRKAAIADMRYSFIEKLCAQTVIKPKESRQHRRSIKIDKVLTNKYLAIPIFFVIMGLVFWLTFGLIGSFLSDLFAGSINTLGSIVGGALEEANVNEILRALIVDGIFAGVGEVISFVPTIIILFFLLSILEDTGYMARVAFVMDKLLRKVGLSGRSIVPMLLGFGCTVPAIMATRTLSSERDRVMTILLTPFMSCSAKLPIYGVFTMAFFPKNRALVMMSLYLLGILIGILSSLTLKKTAFRGNPMPFILELPNYRLPSPKSVVLLLWERTKDFITRAFTIIFLATIVIWLLQSFDIRFNPVTDDANSILAMIGRFMVPIFKPLGLGDWRVSTSLLTGFAAKEAIISTFAVLTGAGGAGLTSALAAMFTPLTAYVFLVFTLLYTPCAAAVSAVRRELGGTLKAVGVVVMQTGVAWIVSYVVFLLGSALI